MTAGARERSQPAHAMRSHNGPTWLCFCAYSCSLNSRARCCCNTYTRANSYKKSANAGVGSADLDVFLQLAGTLLQLLFVQLGGWKAGLMMGRCVSGQSLRHGLLCMPPTAVVSLSLPVCSGLWLHVPTGQANDAKCGGIIEVVVLVNKATEAAQ